MPNPDFSHYRQQFVDNVKDLAGSPHRSVLRELVDKEAKKGSVVYLDAAGTGADVAIKDLKTEKPTRKQYEADTSKSLAKFNDIFTPHNAITQQRTQAEPKLIEWGHNFDKDEDIVEIVDPQNKVVRQGMRTIFKAQDLQVINGIAETSVMRNTAASENEVSLKAVTFPAGQKITTAQAGYLSRKDMTLIVNKFEDQYVSERIFCLISPTMKRNIVDNDDKITDADFLAHAAAFDKSGKFEIGKFPEIFGVHFVVHPLIAANKFYAFTREAIVLNKFKGLESTINKVASQRNSTQAYIDEKCDCKRVDDLQVIHGTLKT